MICLPDYYGPECSVYCVPRNDSIGHYTCNETDGAKICLPDYYGPECSVYCVPRNDSSGHYTCDESDGTKICLPDYYEPECLVYCVPRNDFIGYYMCDETDGSKICMPGFGGENCTDQFTVDTTIGAGDGELVCTVDLRGGTGSPNIHWSGLDNQPITSGVTRTALTSTLSHEVTTSGAVEYICQATIAGLTLQAKVSITIQSK